MQQSASFFNNEKIKLSLGQIALVVPEYDEAILYFTTVLGFRLIEDTPLSESKRWVVISPSDENTGCKLLLAKASTPEQQKAIGNQTGGRVFLFLYTNNLEEYLQRLQGHQVEIINGPRTETYGKVLVFKDLFGNLWDLIEPTLK